MARHAEFITDPKLVAERRIAIYKASRRRDPARSNAAQWELADAYARNKSYNATFYRNDFTYGFGVSSDFNYNRPELHAKRAGGFWCEANGLKHLRKLGYADELVGRSINYTGWFADAHQNEVFRGVVYLLPKCTHSDEHTYLVGYADPNNEGCAFLELFTGDDAHAGEGEGAHRDAAYRADQIAQRCAEEAREYDEYWHACSHLDELGVAVEDAVIGYGDERALLRRTRNTVPGGVERRLTIKACAKARSHAWEPLLETLREFDEARARYEGELYDDPLGHDAAADHNVATAKRTVELHAMFLEGGLIE